MATAEDTRGRIGCLALWALGLVILVAVCLGAHFLPSLTYPVLIAALAAGMIWFVRILGGPDANRFGLPMVLVAALAAILGIFVGTRLVGVVLACVAAAFLPPYVTFAARYIKHVDIKKVDLKYRGNAGTPPTASRYVHVVSVSVGILVGLFVLGLFASDARESPAYYLRYGNLVHVDTRGAQCGFVDLTRGGAVVDTKSSFCDHATWQNGDATVTGRVTDETLTMTLGAGDIRAYAISDTAYAADGIRDGPLVPLGNLPARPLLLPLPVAALALISYSIARRLRSRSRLH